MYKVSRSLLATLVAVYRSSWFFFFRLDILDNIDAETSFYLLLWLTGIHLVLTMDDYKETVSSLHSKEAVHMKAQYL